jgi:hypothetical protein
LDLESGCIEAKLSLQGKVNFLFLEILLIFCGFLTTILLKN